MGRSVTLRNVTPVSSQEPKILSTPPPTPRRQRIGLTVQINKHDLFSNKNSSPPPSKPANNGSSRARLNDDSPADPFFRRPRPLSPARSYTPPKTPPRDFQLACLRQGHENKKPWPTGIENEAFSTPPLEQSSLPICCDQCPSPAGSDDWKDEGYFSCPSSSPRRKYVDDVALEDDDHSMLVNFDGETATPGQAENSTGTESDNVTPPESSSTTCDPFLDPGIRPLHYVRPSRRPLDTARVRMSLCKAPDRFITPRGFENDFQDRLRVSRPVSRLTALEKGSRRRTGLSDPFGPAGEDPQRPSVRQQATPPLPAFEPSSVRGRGALSPQNESAVNTHRQISRGSVWNVGGAVARTDIDIRAPQVLEQTVSSTPRAPRFKSRFFDDLTMEEGLEKHEQRLALAFDFDLANKILPGRSTALEGLITTPEVLKTCASDPGSGAGNSPGRFVWKDNKWIKEGTVHRNYT